MIQADTYSITSQVLTYVNIQHTYARVTSSCFKHQDTANELNSPQIRAASVTVQQRFFFFFALL